MAVLYCTALVSGRDCCRCRWQARAAAAAAVGWCEESCAGLEAVVTDSGGEAPHSSFAPASYASKEA